MAAYGSEGLICGLSKHRGKLWEDLVEEDKAYLEWCISMYGPSLNDQTYDHIVDLLEEASYE